MPLPSPSLPSLDHPLWPHRRARGDRRDRAAAAAEHGDGGAVPRHALPLRQHQQLVHLVSPSACVVHAHASPCAPAVFVHACCIALGASARVRGHAWPQTPRGCVRQSRTRTRVRTHAHTHVRTSTCQVWSSSAATFTCNVDLLHACTRDFFSPCCNTCAMPVCVRLPHPPTPTPPGTCWRTWSSLRACGAVTASGSWALAAASSATARCGGQTGASRWVGGAVLHGRPGPPGLHPCHGGGSVCMGMRVCMCAVLHVCVWFGRVGGWAWRGISCTSEPRRQHSGGGAW